MDKVLLTGSRGFLGSRLLAHYKDKYEILPVLHQDLDITVQEQVAYLISKFQPDVVLHCAAISDTGYAQNHPEESYLVNVTGTVNLAKACKSAGSKFVYMSSDQVYSGGNGQKPHVEDESVVPENHYGIQKLEAEERVQAMLPDAVGLRLTWLYDLPNRNCKSNHNFLWNMIQAKPQKNVLKFSPYDFRGITYAQELVVLMEKITCLPGGIYNTGSQGVANMYETALFTAKLLGIEHIQEMIFEDKERVRNINISNEKMKENGIEFRDTMEGIRYCIEEYGLINKLRDN